MSGSTYLPDQPQPVRAEDVLNALRKQHDAARTSLDELGREFGTSRRSSLHALKLQLACHETAEQKIVHPVAAALGADPAARDRTQEEGESGQLLARLEELDVDSEEFNALFDEFAKDVRQHAAAEERDEWPALAQVSDRTVLGHMFSVVEAVPELARRIDVPALATPYAQMLVWAGEQIDERMPDGLAFDRLHDADESPGQPAVADDAAPRRKRRHRLGRAAGVAGLAAGAYLLGRRRRSGSEPQRAASKRRRPGGGRRPAERR